MTTRRSPLGAQRYAMLAVVLLAPLGLGAKGCDHAVVGDDGTKPGEAGADSGGTGSSTGGTGTGGSAGKGATTGGTGSSTGGTAGTGSSTGGTATGGTGSSTGGTGSSTGGTGSSTGGTGTGGSSGSGALCGGIQGLACGDGEYCSFPLATQCGSGDQTGTCRGIPDACTTNDEPVCGCDDETYSNACEAAMSGVSVAKTGPCEPVGTVCGGFRGGSQCAEDEYCDYPPDAICGRADATGICAAKPEACDLNLAPVCGCDGETYGNACAAATAGVSVEYDGECKDPGAACADSKACADGEFCNDPHCGTADQIGSCEATPGACTKDYVPVCGCDGVTYGNECDAHAHGVSVASTGECGTVPDFCGGIAGIGCPDKMFCDFAIETMCGAGDMGGTCRTMPDGCTEQYQPVCGCDGETYSNACAAAHAGISVQAEGECD